jgi:non-specific serine/threonine protein kinase
MHLSPSLIRLSPLGILHIDLPDKEELSFLRPIEQAFKADFRMGWFRLAADKIDSNTCLALRFWKEISSFYLTQFCYQFNETDALHSLPLDEKQLTEWILSAPPMTGGEYLSPQMLSQLWKDLDRWAQEAALKLGNARLFLTEWAPKWLQVGRVLFHLAENKNDPDRPFAFLATCSTGISHQGKPKHLPLKLALKEYSEKNNRQALIKLLSPINKASEKCPWLKELISSSELYQPLAWPVKKAYQFLSSIPQLEESGIAVRIPNWWRKRTRPQISVTIGSKLQGSLSAQSLLDFKVEASLGDGALSQGELEEILACSEKLICIRGQWIEVDKEKLQEALTHWKMIQKNRMDGISFIDAMRLLAGAPTDLTSSADDDQRRWVTVSAGGALAEILRKLRQPHPLAFQEINGVKAVLRPYQQEGVGWLSLLSQLGLGACLADDMGLGKTVQILSLLTHLAQNPEYAKPSLLVVPASLLSNWKIEAEKFTPSLKLFLLHPSECKSSEWERARNPQEYFASFDLIVTTYSMVVKLEWLSQIRWNLLILDEAQAIKNAGTKQAAAIKKFQSHSRIALTGTPIENRLSELWSLFDFLNPQLLGSAKQFGEFASQLKQYDALKKLISPYILRRMKTDPKIISDLPEKIETPSYCCLTRQQAQYYQATVDELKQSLETVDSILRRGVVLKALLQLKQICNHPSQYRGIEDYNPQESGKFERLKEICEELAMRQEKALIFTQFSEIIPYLEEYLSQIFGKRGLILHGATPIKERNQLVEQFQSESGPPFFILSLKAGGTGLTLTAASHVIHFDRWWNPAVENQATDRAFRIGQKKNVQVHKLITQGTVEEQIDRLIESKKNLVSDILASTDEIKMTELSDEDLLNLIALDINKLKGIYVA